MYPSTTHIGDEPFVSGQLAGVPKVIVMRGAPLPCMVNLQSTNTARKIEVSVDGGNVYTEPPPDTSTTTARSLKITAPVSHVRITGTAGDAYNIL